MNIFLTLISVSEFLNSNFTNTTECNSTECKEVYENLSLWITEVSWKIGTQNID
jgi:hypothetical protein